MFSNRSQSNITISLSGRTPNPHDYISKQTIPTAELIICKGLKTVNCNFREFFPVAALPAVGRCPVSDVAPRERALLRAATGSPGDSAEDPAGSLTTHGRQAFDSHSPSLEYNSDTRGDKQKCILSSVHEFHPNRPNLTEISGVRNSRLISASLRVPEDAENVNENRTTSSREEY